VPAAAVIQERLTLFVVIGCKGYVGSFYIIFIKVKMLFFFFKFKNKNLSYVKNNKISNVKVKIADIRRKAKSGRNYFILTDTNDT